MTKANVASTGSVDSVLAQLEAELSEGRIELPLLPNVAAEVLSSSLDDQADAARLAELIQQDQSLATHVLRVVNSPAFRGAMEIVALQQAIARLGMERIREIALSASLKGSLFKKGPYQVIADESWQVALAAGMWGKEVARNCRKNVEISYLCGLLHNIGTPLLLHRLGEINPDLAREDVIHVLGKLSSKASTTLGEEWQLPEIVVSTIRHISTYSDADEDLVAVAVCGVTMARWMCSDDILVADVMQLSATQRLNLYPEDVETILDKKEEIRQAMESMCV